MALETITPPLSETQKPAERQKPTPSSNMITVDRVTAEKFMLAIEECVGDIEEQRELVDRLIASKSTELELFQSDTIKKFNALIDATNGLKEKIAATESYETYLEEKVRNANLTKEVAMLEQQLQKEKAEISLFIREISNTVAMKLNNVEDTIGSLKCAETVIEEKTAQFIKDIADGISHFEKSAEEKLDEAGSHIQSVAESQVAGFKAECEAMLKSYTEKCRGHLDTVKEQSVDFLRQCEAENKMLIEKIPVVTDRKLSKKDILVYALALTAIASLVAQVFV